MSNRLNIQLVLLLFCFNDFAFADQRWFQVELIVFQQQSMANSELFTQIESELEPVERYARASAGNKTLSKVFNRLKRSSAYRPFYYQSWRVPVSSGSSSLPIEVSGSDVDLKGWIKIQRGHLLHVIADLEFSPSVDVGDRLVYRLFEKRRLLLNEVHYLDHPMFGVVVKVSPVNLE